MEREAQAIPGRTQEELEPGPPFSTQGWRVRSRRPEMAGQARIPWLDAGQGRRRPWDAPYGPGCFRGCGRRERAWR